MENREIDRFQCEMCYFTCRSYNRLIQHYIRYHKHDPRFKVSCVQLGCGSTYTKWKSFRQHLYRKHAVDVPLISDEVIQQAEDENALNQEDIPMHDESFDGKNYVFLHFCVI